MKWKESGQFENPPTGNHLARCYQVIDLGTQLHTFNGEAKMSRDVRLGFELPTCLMEGIYKAEYKGKPFATATTMKQSLHAASSLRGFLQSWRGKKFTPEELANYDPKRLIGVPCRLNLVESETGEYINIDGVSKVGPGEVVPPAYNKPVYFSLERDEFDNEVLASLPEKMREKIMGSPEYKALMAPEQSMPEDDDGGPSEPDSKDPMPF